MRACCAVSILLQIMIAGPGVAAEGPVAIVAELNGNGTVAQGEETRTLVLFDRLETGDSIELAQASTAVIAFASGSRYRVLAKTLAVVEDSRLEVKRGNVKGLEPVATVPAIDAISLAEKPGQRSGAIRIRSGSLWGAEVEDLYPRDGARTLADNAVLTFHSLFDTETYRVDVEDEIGETIFAVETRSNSVVVPQGVLVPGTEYYWRVRSAGRRSLGGRGEALFSTLSVDNAEARMKLKQQTEQEGSLSSLLLQAEVDRSLGLYREACASLERALALARDNEHVVAARADFMCEEYGAQ